MYRHKRTVPFFIKQTCLLKTQIAAHFPLDQDAQSSIQPVHEHFPQGNGTALDVTQSHGSDTHNRWDNKYEQHNLWWGLNKCEKVWIARLLSFIQRSKIPMQIPILVLFTHITGCTHELQLPLDCGKIPGVAMGPHHQGPHSSAWTTWHMRDGEHSVKPLPRQVLYARARKCY